MSIEDYQSQLLLERKNAEDNALRKAQEDALRRHFDIHFEGRGPKLILTKVSFEGRKLIRFTSNFSDDDRLTDILALLRSKLGLKNNEAVTLTHLATQQDGRRLRKPMPCMEWDEEESAGLGDGDESTLSTVEPFGLDPQMMLRDVGLFRNNVTVIFTVNEDLEFKFPPDTSLPRKMPSGELVKHLRERLKVRRRQQQNR
jgi:hypothetical protein